MFQKVNRQAFLPLLRKAGIDRQVEAVHHLQIVEQVFLERFGEGAKLHAQPIAIQYRSVVVAVVHPAVSEQILNEQEGLLKEINERIGAKAIYRFRFSFQKQGEEHA